MSDTPVRAFNEKGVLAVRRLLETMRRSNKFLPEVIEQRLFDSTYTEKVDGVKPIDRSKTFATKLDLVNYFVPHFGEEFLEAHRSDQGLWTWLAMAYASCFAKRGKDFGKIVTDSRWIFEYKSNLTARRHFVAGLVYMYLDFRLCGAEMIDMNFCGPVYQFNTISDVITHYNSLMQSPAALTVIGWLYHDPKNVKRIKRGAASHVRQLATFMERVDRTWDMYEPGTASKLWNKLPKAFESYKGNHTH